MHVQAQALKLPPPPALQDCLPEGDGHGAAAHVGQRTPDEAQEMLARDWAACERQAVLMGAFGIW